MSVIIEKLKTRIAKPKKEAEELTQSGVSLKVAVSQSLAERQDNYRLFYRFLQGETNVYDNGKEEKNLKENGDPLLSNLKDLEKKMAKTNEIISTDVAPYLRGAENPQYVKLMAYFEDFYKLSWFDLQHTVSYVKSVAKTQNEKIMEEPEQEKGNGNPEKNMFVSMPHVDLTNLVNRQVNYIEEELFPMALFLMKTAYFDKDVAPVFVFSTMELPTKRQIPVNV